MKDGSSLVVTPSSIPNFATCVLDVDLSSEGSEDVLEDPDDEPVLKKRIFDSDDEESVPPEVEFIGICLSSFLPFFFLPSSFFPLFLSSLPYTYVLASPLCYNLPLFVCLFLCFTGTFKGLGVAVDFGMPSATTPATPITPVSAISTAPVSTIPSVPAVHSVPVSAVPTTPILTSPGEFLISSLVSFSRVYYS